MIAGGVTLGRSISGSGTVELPYLRVANVQDGFIDTREMKTVRILRTELDRYRLRAGDVLMTEGGDFDKLGRGSVWDGSIDPVFIRIMFFAYDVIRPCCCLNSWPCTPLLPLEGAILY